MFFKRFIPQLSVALLAGIALASFVVVCGPTLAMAKSLVGAGQMESSFHFAGFENHDTCCQMNASEHVPLGKIISSSLPVSPFVALYVLAAVLLMAALNFIALKSDGRESISNYYFYLKRHRLEIKNYLQTAFSQGLLNPKLYSA